jgi:FkbM family methyltransferase
MKGQKAFAGTRYLFASLLFWKRHILVRVECVKLLLFVFRRDVVGRTLFKTGCWDKPITEYLLGKINKIPINVIDVGANLGYYSCMFSLESSADSKILAVEPDDENFYILLKNIKLNSLKNIATRKLAISDCSGYGYIERYKSSNRGKHHLIEDSLADESVSIFTLDELLLENFQRGEQIDFLKIDIEGHELRALRGGQETLNRTKNLIIEYLPELYTQSEKDELRKMLKDNFKYYFHDVNGFMEQSSLDPIISSQDPLNIIAYK